MNTTQSSLLYYITIDKSRPNSLTGTIVMRVFFFFYSTAQTLLLDYLMPESNSLLNKQY